MVRGATTVQILLTLLATGLVVGGIAALVRSWQVMGTGLVVAGLLVGPGALALLR